METETLRNLFESVLKQIQNSGERHTEISFQENKEKMLTANTTVWNQGERADFQMEGNREIDRIFRETFEGPIIKIACYSALSDDRSERPFWHSCHVRFFFPDGREASAQITVSENERTLEAFNSLCGDFPQWAKETLAEMRELLLALVAPWHPKCRTARLPDRQMAA